MLDLKAIDHVTLFVRDLEPVKPYYESVFGFRCTLLERNGSRDLQLETGTTHFFFTEDQLVPDSLVRKQHISFEVDSLAAVIHLLEERGDSYKTGRYTGFEVRNYDWCEWLDPSGIRVECVAHL